MAASFPTRLILSFGLAVAGLAFQSAQAAIWSGGGADANWSTALNWDVALADSFSTSLVFAGSAQTTNTNDLTGGTATSITFNSGADAFVLGGTSIALGGNITNSSTSLQTINLPMTTSVSNTVTTAASGGDITLGGVIGGNGNITKAGSGTLIVSGANTYTGNTIVSAGILKNGSATTFTRKGAIILNGTGTFDLNGFDASFNNEGGSVAANTITNNGAADATLTISGTNSGNFAGLLSDGTRKLGVAMSNNNSFGIFLSNTGNTFSGGLTLLNQGPNGTRLSITQAIVTTGSPGAITSSTYGTGPITIGQIATDRAGILINVATTLPNAIVFNTALGNDNPGIRLEANGIILSGDITANSNAAFSGAGASATVSGVISGTGGLTSTNSGVLTLSGTNTYTGNTTISAGTLKNGSASTFTNKGSLTMNGTGTLDLNGFNASFKEFGSGSVAGNTITNSGASDATLALATVSFNNTLAALVKDGTTNKLALTFSNNNQFINFLTNPANTFSGGLTLLNHSGGLGGTRLAILSPIVTTGSPGAITSSTLGIGPITIGQTSTDRAGIIFATTNNNTLANDIVFNTALGSDQPGIRFGTTGNVLSGSITANSDAAFSGPSPGSATVSGVISGVGGVSVSEGVAITLSGVNTYTGNTTVNGGTLIVATNSATTFADTSTVSIASGAVLDLPNAATDTVTRLVINGSILPAGIYDASSPATSGFITGSGKIQSISGGYSSWAATNVGGDPANADTDLDGVANGVEYFMNSATGFTANPAVVVSAGPVRTVTWPNGGNIPSAAYGTQFVVQTSPDLGIWTDVLSGDPNLSNTSGAVAYTLPPGADEIFVRLMVTPN
ncbi:MAG: autotransporter-associated beta strand repeat-containing protein [Verrucomicrobiota bacterium]